ncbi:unnamed protein product [Discosporangium mesarthrocarpum]
MQEVSDREEMDHANADIERYDRTDGGKGHVVYTIRVNFRNTSWLLEKRYNDFVQLHQELARELKEADRDMLELPPRRLFGRFQPDFLRERMEQLQSYLDCCGQIAVTYSETLAKFLRVADHVVWGNQAGMVLTNGDADAEGREAIIQAHLRAVVDRNSKRLIDNSRVGVDMPDEAQKRVQRASLLKDCDYFRTHEKHFKGFFLRKLPDTPPDLLEADTLKSTLGGPCNPTVEQQGQVIEKAIEQVAGHMRAEILPVSGNLVTHM